MASDGTNAENTSTTTANKPSVTESTSSASTINPPSRNPLPETPPPSSAPAPVVSRKRAYDETDPKPKLPDNDTTTNSQLTATEFNSCSSPARKEIKRSGSRLNSESSAFKPSLLTMNKENNGFAKLTEVSKTSGGFPITEKAKLGTNPFAAKSVDQTFNQVSSSNGTSKPVPSSSIFQNTVSSFSALKPKEETKKITNGFGALSSSSVGGGFGASTGNAFAKMISGTSAWGVKSALSSGGSVGGFDWLKKKEDKPKTEEKLDSSQEVEEQGSKFSEGDSKDTPKKQFGEDRDECKMDLVEVKTGEENETPVIETMAKLFYFEQHTKKYVERGAGKLRLLDPKPTDDNKYSSRLTMRGQGTHRLVLNTLIWSKMCFETTNSPNTLRMSAKHWETGEIGIYLVRCNEKVAKELFKAIDYRLNRLKHLVEQCSLEEREASQNNLIMNRTSTTESTQNGSQSENESRNNTTTENETTSQEEESRESQTSQDSSVTQASSQMSQQRINSEASSQEI
jgi:Ran-binding protein 3